MNKLGRIWDFVKFHSRLSRDHSSKLCQTLTKDCQYSADKIHISVLDTAPIFSSKVAGIYFYTLILLQGLKKVED